MRHARVVQDIHDDVASSTDAKLAVGVRSVGAKVMPVRVAVSPPDEGVLLLPTRAKLTTGPGVGKMQIMTATQLEFINSRFQDSVSNYKQNIGIPRRKILLTTETMIRAIEREQ